MGKIASESTLGAIDNLSNIELIHTYFHFGLITKDKDDNKFVDCAIASNADFILTEDRDFKVLEEIEFPKVNVISIDNFQKILEKSGT